MNIFFQNDRDAIAPATENHGYSLCSKEVLYLKRMLYEVFCK
jgi:hypothetical protein